MTGLPTRTEADLVRWLGRQQGPGSGVELGIGDDAAVVRVGDERLVLASDQIVEGVHFVADEDPWHWVGRKALARNLSDLAAMGATPWLALSSLCWPAERPAAQCRELMQGLLDLADDNQTTLVGGDSAGSPGGVHLDVTVVGRLASQSPMLRSGARVGDDLVVTGCLGGSREGHHLTFTPRWREGVALARSGLVHAAIDLSDGFSLDLHRMLEASGVGAEVQAAALPRRRDAQGHKVSLAAALGDGEDFELLCCVAAGRWSELAELPELQEAGLRKVGHIARDGVTLVQSDRSVTTLTPRGYEHRMGHGNADEFCR